MFDSILVICTGNICRSPTAERLLRKLIPEKQIDSAGIAALVDHEADASAAAVAEEHGVSLAGHKGTQFRSTLGKKYDLILVMEKSHIESISQVSPEARGKVLLLGHWLGQKEIPDPYQKSHEAFEYVYQLIDQSCQQWVKKLN
ncbi:protein tyrosine phosphatase [Pantoea cypripedii]|uniref:protein-tyrosine-phosphatase n=1 Tax=Pantoea cypripedii TaxID=55209 RepID=A0A1X1EJR7_PANCY|nr:protein tyrosine phosphatase [Pantoea cypripedii]MBP2200334.1 protein-tyrosine phosphatase [Pantoea cypripedii]ORM89139.1 protein tyrosine phosphatase [Pantoea cypripedii]